MRRTEGGISDFEFKLRALEFMKSQKFGEK